MQAQKQKKHIHTRKILLSIFNIILLAYFCLFFFIPHFNWFIVGGVLGIMFGITLLIVFLSMTYES